jgi:hypothetical protein
MVQPELNFRPPPPRNPDRLEAMFIEFHSKNPNVYEKFCECCEQLIRAGISRYSADAIMHRIRFDFDVEVRSTSTGPDGQHLKINNSIVRLFAEKWTKEHPGHPEFFESRKNQHT